MFWLHCFPFAPLGRFRVLRLACALATMLVAPASLAEPPGGSDWNVVFSDEFEGDGLDLQKWRHQSTGLRREAYNTPGAVRVTGGNLVISTFTSGGAHYTGMVSTAETFLYAYGYVEARINFDSSPGMWSAFWMQSPTMTNASLYATDPNLAGTEIDICEHRSIDAGGASIDAKIVGNIHWGGYGADHESTGYTSPNLDLGGGYHVYGLEWTPTQQRFYIDGVLRWTVNNGANSPVSNAPEYLWLSSEVENSWSGAPPSSYGSLDTTTTKMRVDYVRLYQPAGTILNADFQGRLAPFEAENQAAWSATGGRANARAGRLAPTTGAGASLRQSLTGLWPETGYVLTAWGNAGMTNPSLFLGVEDHGFPATGQTLTAAGYAQAAVPFTTGATNRSATVLARSNNAGSVAYVDDFLLRRAATVTNARLETGDGSAWTSAYGGAVVDNADSYDGSYAWKIPASGSSAGVEQAIAGLTPNTPYRLTGWTTNGGAGLTFGVKNHGASQVTSTVSTSTWAQATVPFTTGPSATTATIFAFRGSSAQASYADAFFVSQALAAPWSAQDISTLPLAGTSGRLGQKFVMQSTGGNISGGSDRCHLIHQPWNGDGTLTARVLAAEAVSGTAKAGLMLRDTTAPNSRAVALTWNATTGAIDFVRRGTAGAGPAITSLAAGSVPNPPWLRLTRRGNEFTPYWSPDGVTWSRADVPRSLTLNANLLAGLAYATGDETRLGEAAFDRVALTAAVPDVVVTEPADGSSHAANGSSLRLVATLAGGTGATLQWSQLSGPGSITFSNPTSAITHAVFSAPGLYVLRCAVTNGAGTGTAEHTIHVTPFFAADASLALHLKLDESTGSTAADSSGHGIVASIAGSVTWQPAGGKLAGAAALNGTSGYFTVPDDPSLDGAGAFTLSCWFKADNFVGNSALIAKRVSDSSQNAYCIGCASGDNAGRLRFDLNTTNDRFYSTTTFNAGEWYHVALVFDGTLATAQRARLYVNGVLDVTADETSATIINSTAPLLIGRASTTDTSYFDGLVDEVRFHRRALTAAEVFALAHETAASVPFVSAGSAPSAVVGTPANLTGSVDTGSGPAATVQWTKVSGPGAVAFGSANAPATSVTFGQGGAYVLRLTATSSAGQVYNNLTVSVPESSAVFADWQKLTWPGITDPLIIGPEADPDADGVSNVLEWALHLSATVPGTFVPRIESIGASRYFTYTRRRTAAGAANFQVEWSDTLTNTWSTAGVGSPEIVSQTSSSETVSVPIPMTSTRRFFHLKVTAP